jgi:hypothetical protein
VKLATQVYSISRKEMSALKCEHGSISTLPASPLQTYGTGTVMNSYLLNDDDPPFILPPQIPTYLSPSRCPHSRSQWHCGRITLVDLCVRLLYQVW